MEVGIFARHFALAGPKATFGLRPACASHKTGVIQASPPRWQRGANRARCGAAFSQNSPYVFPLLAPYRGWEDLRGRASATRIQPLDDADSAVAVRLRSHVGRRSDRGGRHPPRDEFGLMASGEAVRDGLEFCGLGLPRGVLQGPQLSPPAAARSALVERPADWRSWPREPRPTWKDSRPARRHFCGASTRCRPSGNSCSIFISGGDSTWSRSARSCTARRGPSTNCWSACDGAARLRPPAVERRRSLYERSPFRA